MNIDKLSVKGSSAWNEDALVALEDQGVFAVIDGATSLTPYAGPAGETGGYLASRIVADVLTRMLSGPGASSVSLTDCLLEANRALRHEMRRAGIDTSRKEQLWCAGAVVVRIRDTRVEYAQAGDCILVAMYRDGTFRVVTRDQLAPIDLETQTLWAKAAAELGFRDAIWERVKPQIVRGRRTANTPSGYAVLNGEEIFADYVEYGAINRLQLDALLLMTDGLYVPKPPGERPFDAEETARHIASMGLEPYVRWLIRREQSDPQCLRYPRVKMSDDKTAVWIRF